MNVINIVKEKYVNYATANIARHNETLTKRERVIGGIVNVLTPCTSASVNAIEYIRILTKKERTITINVSPDMVR